MRVGDWDTSLGALIARLRRDGGLTQEQLAERSGLSVRAISSIECGSRLPRRFTMERLAGALDLTAEQRATIAGLAARARYRDSRAPGASVLPLVGRREEVAALRELLAGRGPGLLAIGGEPGIGKSRLLAEALELAAFHATAVLAGVCRRGADPYAPIVDALADHIGHSSAADLAASLRGCAGLELLLPELSSPGPSRPGLPGAPAGGMGMSTGLVTGGMAGQQRRLVFAAVRQFLTNLAGTGRVLLVLDDLQWAGPDTADLIAHLLRYASPQVRVVMAYRTGDVSHTGRLAECVADLARLNHVRRIRLAPLSRVESDALVSLVAGAGVLDGDRRSRILRRAGGLPLFLIELTQAALVAAGEEVPTNLRLAVAQQVAALPEPALSLLRRMATLGAAVPVEDLTGTGESLDTVVAALETSRRYGILDETATGYRFRFPLIQELLMLGVGRNQRRLWSMRGLTGQARPAV